MDMAGELTISQLIDSDTGGWNHYLVESLFLPFEAQRIMGIPLCMSRQEDCIIWPRCNLGVYLVKTSYQMLCELENCEGASASNLETSKKFCGSIWKLGVPNKVKIFLWRACYSDALLTKVSLQKRKGLDNSLCNECQIAPGDSFHALRSCEALNSVWLPKISWLRSRYT